MKIALAFMLLILSSGLYATQAFAREICPAFPDPVPQAKQTEAGGKGDRLKPPVKTTAADRARIDALLKFPDIHGGDVGPTLVFVGDSLTQGVGASKDNSYPKVLAREIDPGSVRRFEVYAVSGKASNVIADLFAKQTVKPDDVGVIWVGRNNIEQADRIVSDVAKISEKFASKQFFVIPVSKGLWLSEQNGPKGVMIDKINIALQERFPGAVIPIESVMGCTDYADNTHFNDSGYRKIAGLLRDEIVKRGW